MYNASEILYGWRRSQKTSYVTHSLTLCIMTPDTVFEILMFSYQSELSCLHKPIPLRWYIELSISLPWQAPIRIDNGITLLSLDILKLPRYSVQPFSQRTEIMVISYMRIKPQCGSSVTGPFTRFSWRSIAHLFSVVLRLRLNWGQLLLTWNKMEMHSHAISNCKRYAV